MRLITVLWLCVTLSLTSLEARKSSGRRIIDTAKHAMRDVSRRRQRRDVSVLSKEATSLDRPAGVHLVEFDLLLDDDQYSSLGKIGGRKTSRHLRQKRKAVRHSIYHWPGAEVPYEIHSSVDDVSSAARHRISKAMTHWQQHTCIKFVPYDPLRHTNYVSIRKGQWCASKLGMTGGVQPLYVALGCLDTGTIIHELGHTIGWVHEQARPDRDDYITIKWSLVSASYRSQYVKHGADFVNTYGVPYDYDSIMHYPSYGELITTDPAAQYRIGQRNRLSFYDVQLANKMYQCAARSGCDTSSLECVDGGFIGHECKCVCPNGNSDSCTVTNSVLKPYPKVKVTVSPSPPACQPWKVYDNAYIPGHNDDIGFSVSIEECKQRCLTETSFRCMSFDYWKLRRQCYLSSSTVAGLGIRFSYDSRMVHYQLDECAVKANKTKPTTTKTTAATTTSTTTSTTSTTSTTTAAVTTTEKSTQESTSSIRPVAPTVDRKYCPFEYANTGLHCIRALAYPARPVHIATIECEQKLGAEMWQAEKDEWTGSSISDLVGEGEEYWVRIKDFKSDNIMASFFDFCPYITKENGAVVLKDTLCFKQKGFMCQLTASQ